MNDLRKLKQQENCFESQLGNLCINKMLYDQNVLIDRIKQKEIEFLNNIEIKTKVIEKDKKICDSKEDDNVSTDGEKESNNLVV